MFVDPETDVALRNLFSRRGDPLTTAILTPIAVNPGSGSYYGKRESVPMANCLIESAKKIIIMAPANRLYTDPEPFPDAKFWERTWFGGGFKEMFLVVAGTPRDGELRDLVDIFQHANGQIKWNVHWTERMSL